MIVVKLAGGLGNQMFQYAAGRFLSEKHHTILKLDLSFLLDRTPRKDFVYRDYDLGLFNIQEEFASSDEIVVFNGPQKFARMVRIVKEMLDCSTLAYAPETPFRFDPRFFRIRANAYLDGYWQSEDYFSQIDSLLRKEFTFRKGLDDRSREMARRIEGVNAVCLNVRRGDFISNPGSNRTHGVCGLGYYSLAVNTISEKVEEPHFFVFSDDVRWCQENIRMKHPCTVLGHEYAGEKFGHYLDLMIRCKHYIIPNSSFGWWAAWLGGDSNKVVIAPKCWYRDLRVDTSHLFPSNWIKL